MNNSNSNYFDLWAKEYSNLPDEKSFHLGYIGKLVSKKYDLNANKKSLNVMDLGVGNGRFLPTLYCKFSKIVGIDASKEQLGLAKKNLQKICEYLDLVQYDLEKGIPTENQNIDLTVSNAAIHHIKDKVGLFQEVYRVLRKGGTFVFFDFYFEGSNKDIIKDVLSKQIRDPLISEKFISSIKKEHDLMPKHLEEGHPEEYHKSPKSLIKLLELSGFHECEIMPTFYSKYLGVGCKK